MILVIITFSTGMERFNKGTFPTPVEERIENLISICVEILMQPMLPVYDAIPREIQNDFIEWSLVTINSLLWGFSILFLWRLLPAKEIDHLN